MKMTLDDMTGLWQWWSNLIANHVQNLVFLPA